MLANIAAIRAEDKHNPIAGSWCLLAIGS